jgi:hypothetical protein
VVVVVGTSTGDRSSCILPNGQAGIELLQMKFSFRVVDHQHTNNILRFRPNSRHEQTFQLLRMDGVWLKQQALLDSGEAFWSFFEMWMSELTVGPECFYYCFFSAFFNFASVDHSCT